LRRSLEGRGPLLALGLVLALLYLPMVQLVLNSVNADPIGVSWKGFSGEWYRAAFDDDGVRRALMTSLKLALVSGVGAVIFGTAAVMAVRLTKRARRAVKLTAVARVTTPEVVLAAGLAVVFPLIGWTFGFMTMAIGHVVALTAYVVLVVGARAARLQPSLEEAALDLGAGPWTAFRTVVFPELRGAIAASGLLAAAFSFDDLLLSLRLSGPDDATLPMVILSLTLRRPSPELDAIGTLVIVGSAIVFATALTADRLLSHRTFTRPGAPW
jgi:ABC-type spermidine/putrescine transport system permease subunit II